jgi:hypothetical protein
VRSLVFNESANRLYSASDDNTINMGFAYSHMYSHITGT